MTNELTVCLPLYKRESFTLRFLEHVNHLHIPYKFLICDGSPTASLSATLKDKSSFPYVSYDYYEYHDTCCKDYIEKMFTTLSQVKTKYVLLAENDDFLIPTGINKSVEFLDKNLEFIACGGRIARFHLLPKTTDKFALYGKPSLFDARFFYDLLPKYAESCDEVLRIKGLFASYNTTFYHVYRTEVLFKVFEELRSLSIGDFLAFELFLAGRVALLGPVKTDSQILHYCRQIGTSLQSGTVARDWFNHLLRTKLTDDYREILSKLSHAFNTSDQLQIEDYYDFLLDLTAKRLQKKSHKAQHPFLVKINSLSYYFISIIPRIHKILLLHFPYELSSISSVIRRLDPATQKSYIKDFKSILKILEPISKTKLTNG